MKVCTPGGLHTWPPGKPGVLKPLRSHGCTARPSIALAPLPAYSGTTCSPAGAISHALALASKLARRHDLVDQAQALGGIDREVLALEQDGRGVHHADQARDALRAAAARQQADLDLGLADLGLGVGRGDAVVAGEADLEAAAQRGAVDRGHDRLAAGLLAAEHLLQLAELVHQLGGIRRVGAQKHFEVGAGDEVGLGRGQDDALDLVVLDRLLDRAGIGRHRGLVQHVHAAARHVPGDGGDAVAVDVVVDHGRNPFRRAR